MTDPRSGAAFTEDGAWEYVAEQIEAGIAIEVIQLEIPPGKRGYVMHLPSHDASVPIYVKLQLGSGVVVGRSFHYSTAETERREQ